MIFRRKPLDRPFAPVRAIATNPATTRRRLVACWRRDPSGRLIPYWKAVAAPQDKPSG